ncbi:hypothetical protein GP486_007812, partial [Trichoglossum hirsutum]
MAPRAKTTSTKKRLSQPRTSRRNSTPIVKEPPVRKSLRLQNKPPASHAAQSRPVQSSAPRPACTKPKRPQPKVTKKTKKKRPGKQYRRCTPSRLELNESKGVHPSEQLPPPPLPEADLQSLYEEVMAKNAQMPKRALSQSQHTLSLSQLEVDTAESQRTSNVHISYRLGPLAAFQIYFHVDPPDDIKAVINDAVNAKVSEKRLVKLRTIAQNFSEKCREQVISLSGKDDFLDPLRFALEHLGFKSLGLRTKTNWREDLKPARQRLPDFGKNIKAGVQQLEVDHVSPPSSKRQRQSLGESEYSWTNAPTVPPANNPQESSTMPPPPAPHLRKGGGRELAKYTCPDLSIGITLSALISALSSENLNRAKVEGFIRWLRDAEVQREPDALPKPLLIFTPTISQTFTFPFAVEAKAYATGRQLFEAENQAALSGACALKMRLDLDDLINSGTT